MAESHRGAQVDLLRRRQTEQSEERLAAGSAWSAPSRPGRSGLVFTTKLGEEPALGQYLLVIEHEHPRHRNLGQVQRNVLDVLDRADLDDPDVAYAPHWIAEMADLSVAQVHRALRGLQRRELVEVHHDDDGDKFYSIVRFVRSTAHSQGYFERIAPVPDPDDHPVQWRPGRVTMLGGRAPRYLPGDQRPITNNDPK